MLAEPMTGTPSNLAKGKILYIRMCDSIYEIELSVEVTYPKEGDGPFFPGLSFHRR